MLSGCNIHYAHSTRKASSSKQHVFRRLVVARHILSRTRPTVPVPAVAGHHHHLTLQQYDDFELLWLEYRHTLSISKASCLWALQDVQRGLLPADADLLRGRAEGVTALARLRGTKIDALRILNSSRSVLTYDARHFQSTVTRLLQLLPNVNHTQLLLDTAADLDLPPEVLALQYQELDMLFKARLGAHITAQPLHYLLQRLGSTDTSGTLQQQQQSTPQAAAFSSFQQVLQTSAGLSQQLQALAAMLGPELANAAVQNSPQLLETSVERVQANLQWLQQQLRLSPVSAMLLAAGCGGLLLLPSSQLDQNYTNLRYLLQELLGWRAQQIRTAVYNAPQLLVADSQQCASQWQQVQRLARRRLAWLEELSNAGASLMAGVLCARPVQSAMLQYAGDTGDLRSKGLGQTLNMEYVDFIRECPGFRSWRALAPGRWRYFADREDISSTDATGGRTGGGVGSEGAVVGDSACGNDHDSSLAAVPRQVLARDRLGRPVLVAVGRLGHLDRLA